MKYTTRLIDVAAYAGVSISTVSRVINNKDRVKSEVRVKVKEAIRALNYVPNEVARSLKNKAIRAIGVIVVDIGNPFFAKIIRGVEQIAYDAGFYTIVCNSDHNYDRELIQSQMLLSMNVSGLIVATSAKDNSIEQMYVAAGIPIVYVDNSPAWETSSSMVTIDSSGATQKMIDHLINLGHKDIGVAYERDSISTTSRDLGWLRAMERQKLSINENWIINTDYTAKGCLKAMQAMIDKGSLPTAMIATNNLIAYELIRGIRSRGLKVPEDISVIAFDAEDDSGLMVPKLTGVIQPAQNIGKTAAQIIIRMNRNEEQLPIKEHLILSVKWSEGKSTGLATVNRTEKIRR